jgi:WD40 repeat protein
MARQVSSKILCLAWTPDGALLAAGCFDGTVSIRDRGGNETARVAAAATPAWSVAWSPEDAPTLAVGCLDGLLRFFNAAGVQKHRDRQVQGDPLALAYLGEEHLMAAGTDGCGARGAGVRRAVGAASNGLCTRATHSPRVQPALKGPGNPTRRTIQMLSREGVSLVTLQGRTRWAL